METEIKTPADALKYLKLTKKNIPKISGIPKKEQAQILATWWRDLIVKAINKKFNGGKIFKPNFEDGNSKYFIWWVWQKGTKGKKSGFRFDDATGVWTDALTYVGPRLTWVSREAARYFGENPEFVKIYNESVEL